MKKTMIELDGAEGEGGGQILRTALSLAMLTGQAFRMVNIRAKRARPGLMRQHLVCIEASQAISNARVSSAEAGATSITFEPGTVQSGDHTFMTGGAGSTTLIFQTIVLPLALRGEAPSSLGFSGGTHNPMAPPTDYLEHVFLPQLAAMGVKVSLSFEKHGFYPAGGGAWRATIHPAKVTDARPLHLNERGPSVLLDARALLAQLDRNIGHRELLALRGAVPALGAEACEVIDVASSGPGNVLTLACTCERTSERFYGFGMRGVSAERVAADVAKQARAYLSADVPVGEHLADQLLLPMAMLRGGTFRTVNPSLHFETQVRTLKRFLPDMRIDVAQDGPESWAVTVG